MAGIREGQIKKYWMHGECAGCGKITWIDDNYRCNRCNFGRSMMIADLRNEPKECKSCGKIMEKSYERSGMCKECYEDRKEKKEAFNRYVRTLRPYR